LEIYLRMKRIAFGVKFFHGTWKLLHWHTLPEFVPRIAFYREYYSSGITYVMEADEVEKRAKNVPKSG